jgi:acetoin utilization deacetylase AcuC-like enzyme
LIHDALLAVGGAITAADAVLNQEVKNSFVLARPPGHHAGRSQGAGFCYLNNVAIMVRHLQRRGLRRIMILDWDAHHGNGTEEIFYDDPSVFFVQSISTHFIQVLDGMKTSESERKKGII